MLVAKAGLIEDRPATTHHGVLEELLHAPLVNNLFKLFEAGDKIGYRNAFIGLMCLFEQTGAADIGVDTDLLKLATIG